MKKLIIAAMLASPFAMASEWEEYRLTPVSSYNAYGQDEEPVLLRINPKTGQAFWGREPLHKIGEFSPFGLGKCEIKTHVRGLFAEKVFNCEAGEYASLFESKTFNVNQAGEVTANLHNMRGGKTQFFAQYEGVRIK